MIKNKDKNRMVNTRTAKNTQQDFNRNKKNRTPSRASDKKSMENYSSDEEPNRNSAKKGTFGNTKKNIGRKRSSVVDSDTESSRMRKMTNYVSPYRQATKPNKLNSNRSNKSINSDRSRSQSADKKSLKKYNNISNLYPNKYSKQNNQKAKSIEKKSQKNFVEEESFEDEQNNQYQCT